VELSDQTDRYGYKSVTLLGCSVKHNNTFPICYWSSPHRNWFNHQSTL